MFYRCNRIHNRISIKPLRNLFNATHLWENEVSARLSTDLVDISHFRSNVLLYFVFLLWSINHCFQIIPKTIAVYAWLRVFTHPWYESVLKRWKWFIIVSVFGSVLIGILLSHFKIPHRFTTIFTQISKVFCIFDEEKKNTPLFSANKRKQRVGFGKDIPRLM